MPAIRDLLKLIIRQGKEVILAWRNIMQSFDRSLLPFIFEKVTNRKVNTNEKD